MLLILFVGFHSQFPWVLSIVPAAKHSSCPMEKRKMACQEICYIKHPDVSFIGKVNYLKPLKEYGVIFVSIEDIYFIRHIKDIDGFYIISPRSPPLAFSFHLRAPPIS